MRQLGYNNFNLLVKLISILLIQAVILLSAGPALSSQTSTLSPSESMSTIKPAVNNMYDLVATKGINPAEIALMEEESDSEETNNPVRSFIQRATHTIAVLFINAIPAAAGDFTAQDVFNAFPLIGDLIPTVFFGTLLIIGTRLVFKFLPTKEKQTPLPKQSDEAFIFSPTSPRTKGDARIRVNRYIQENLEGDRALRLAMEKLKEDGLEQRDKEMLQNVRSIFADRGNTAAAALADDTLRASARGQATVGSRVGSSRASSERGHLSD